MRRAPSKRMTSPLSIELCTIWLTNCMLLCEADAFHNHHLFHPTWANSWGRPRRLGKGTD
jgi:hypothetical protein